MDVRDFDFDLPADLIAQEPAVQRSAARLLHLDRSTGSIAHSTIGELPELLQFGDVVVVNNTRVFPARLLGHRIPSGGAVECLLVRRLGHLMTGSDPDLTESDADLTGSDPNSGPCNSAPAKLLQRETGSDPGPRHFVTGSDPTGARWERHFLTGSDPAGARWEALMHPGQKLRPGARVVFEGMRTVHGEVLEQHFFGRRTIRLWTDDGSPLDQAIDAIGHVPLPPYIKRDDAAADRDRYQTIFARHRGSVAAPTAGLHFTAPLVAALRARGVEVAEITLHVGYGTFQPVRVERVEDHVVEPEEYEIDSDAARTINAAVAERRRLVAVGTTTTRTLEAAARDGMVSGGRGTTGLFIYPGFEFRVVGALLTNFHLPRSSLLMLVSAFAGRQAVLAAYDAAIRERYRFYSYGDAMLIT